MAKKIIYFICLFLFYSRALAFVWRIKKTKALPFFNLIFFLSYKLKKFSSQFVSKYYFLSLNLKSVEYFGQKHFLLFCISLFIYHLLPKWRSEIRDERKRSRIVLQVSELFTSIPVENSRHVLHLLAKRELYFGIILRAQDNFSGTYISYFYKLCIWNANG